tara:strand:- start:61 stop:549 length:489 start_codon:yes stop_codon:yes gene_type:complete
MNYFKICLGIFAAIAASRFIPHPPNFTSLIALSFYVPALLGTRFIPALILSFALTDLVIGFHSTTLFTWGSVLLIGLISKFFVSSLKTRLSGALFGACLFYLITNFGVWSLGSYGYSIDGLVNCYLLALPFFGYTMVSTALYSSTIEILYSIYRKKFFKFKN